MKAKMKIFLAALLLLALLLPLNLIAGGQAEAKKTGTVKYWHGYPEFDPVWKDMAGQDFMAENPGVKVEISSFPLREFERKLAVALPAGTGPDLYYFDLSFNVKFIEAGLVANPPANVEAFIKKGFAKAFQDLATYKGKLWGLPYGGELKVAYWNTDMYAEAGLDHAPTNWDELIDFGRKTTKYDASGNVTRSGVSLRLSGGGSGIAEKFWMWMIPAGTTIAEAGKEAGKYHAAYDNEAGRNTLKLYIDLLHKYKVDSHKIKHDAEALALEQTAYFQRESWVIGYMNEHAPNVKYDVAQLPVGTRVGGPTMGTNLNIYSKSKAQDLAWEFALHLENEKYLKAVINDVGWLTSRSDISYEDVFQKEPRLRPAMTMPENFHGESYPLTTAADEIYTKLAEKLVPAFQDAGLVDNPAGIAKIISEAAKQTNDILKEAEAYGE